MWSKSLKLAPAGWRLAGDIAHLGWEGCGQGGGGVSNAHGLLLLAIAGRPYKRGWAPGVYMDTALSFDIGPPREAGGPGGGPGWSKAIPDDMLVLWGTVKVHHVL